MTFSQEKKNSRRDFFKQKYENRTVFQIYFLQFVKMNIKIERSRNFSNFLL